MKNTMKFALTLLMIGLLGLSACEDEVSQPTVQIEFNPDNTQESISAGRVAANSLTFTSGTIRLIEIEFETETDNGDSVEVNIEQIVEIDFATGETTPDLSAVTFPLGTYVESSVELELLDNNTDPSIDIEGTFVDSQDQSHTIRFIFTSGETFEVEREVPITFTEGESVIASVIFDPHVWFAGITSAHLEAAVKDNNGVIVISENSNAGIFDIVADGLDLATELEIE